VNVINLGFLPTVKQLGPSMQQSNQAAVHASLLVVL